MGCHTWFRKPLVKGTDNVKKHLLQELETHRQKDWWNEDCEAEVPLRLQAICSRYTQYYISAPIIVLCKKLFKNFPIFLNYFFHNQIVFSLFHPHPFCLLHYQ